MKAAIVSHALPPSWSGQAVILSKLLRDVDASRYVLISSRATSGAPATGQFISRLPGRTIELPLEPSFGRLARFALARPVRLLEAIWRVRLRARRIAAIARSEGCTVLVACTGDLIDIPAAGLAARRLGVRFIPYLFDDYTYQWADPLKRAFASRVERMLFPGAAAVIAPNEMMEQELRRRHGLSCTIVRNAVEIEDRHGLDLPWPDSSDDLGVVYTGAVYHAHYDAFRNLVTAIGKLGRPQLKLHLYTTQSPEELSAQGIEGPVVFHPHVPAAEVAEIQRRADILFLPLAFHSAIPEVIRTSAPGKTGEYLASGRPVLVHAPADSFVSWYFRRHDCGTVVDVDDPGRLAEALREIIENRDLRRGRALRARQRAESDFAAPRARAALLSVLEGESRSRT